MGRNRSGIGAKIISLARPQMFLLPLSVRVGSCAMITNDPNFRDLFPVHVSCLSQINASVGQLYPGTQVDRVVSICDLAGL